MKEGQAVTQELSARLAQVRARIAAAAVEVGRDPAEITLVAASKTQSPQTVRAAVAAGITCLGENRAQELTEKLSAGAYEGASVHFIGRLQTNKVKYVVGKVDMIESVDSRRLLDEIGRQALRLGVTQDILLQVNIGGEEAKGGCPPEELADLTAAALQTPGVRLRGLMCVPPAPLPGGNNREFFARTRQLFVDIIQKMGDNESDINCLSMGMSGDFEDAVREGATHIRVGSALFGPR